MKITISSQGNTLDSMVDPRFGRAAQFILYDTETEKFEVLSNQQSLNAAQGAGIKAAETLSGCGAEALITGHCGPNAFGTLSAAGIAVYIGADGLTVAQAIDKFKAGELRTAEASDVKGHWQ